MQLSVVVPTLDEAARVGALVARLQAEADEIVVVDAGSADGTAALAEAAGARVLQGPRGRGAQLHAGARAARGELLWFLHADSTVPPGAGEALRQAARTHAWGCFRTEIPSSDPRLRWTAWIMNLRAEITGSATGDMGIWARRGFYEALGGFEPLPAFEDLSFTDRARVFADWAVVSPPLQTSPRRWEVEGVRRTMVRMLRLRWAYRFGADPAELAALYRSRPR